MKTPRCKPHYDEVIGKLSTNEKNSRRKEHLKNHSSKIRKHEKYRLNFSNR